MKTGKGLNAADKVIQLQKSQHFRSVFNSLGFFTFLFFSLTLAFLVVGGSNDGVRFSLPRGVDFAFVIY